MPETVATGAAVRTLEEQELPTRERQRQTAGRFPLVPVVLALAAALLAACCASLLIGTESVAPARLLTAVLDGRDADAEAWSLVVDYRLPRTLVAVAVGAALGVAGAVIQAYTRNPLADPGILGVNAGAALAVIVAIWFGVASSTAALVWPALVGAAIATLLVLLLAAAGRGPATPVRMVLAGVAMAAVFGGITTGIRLSDERTFERFRSWAAGSVAGRDLTDLAAVIPVIIVGLIVGILLVKPLNAVALGDDVAAALGVSVATVRLATVASVALLAGAATAVAGPIGFVGLMIPHTVRLLVGNDQTRIIPLSVLAAPTLLLVADTLARVVVPLREVPVGIVTALIGGPVLIALIRNKAVDTQ
ncbi:MAG: iron ABC transporter permease [Actinomycetales bacterium]|nr:iron ABC transporter permease [Actinomycetales bacterium]